MNRLNAPFHIGFLAAATMLTIAGCGGNGSEPGKTGSTAPTAAKATNTVGSPLVVKEVVDARLAKDPEGNPVIIGSINGTSLMDGDKVIVNNGATFGTFFGNDTWITFSIPVSAVGNQKSFTLQVIRPSTQEKSPTFTVNVKQ